MGVSYAATAESSRASVAVPLLAASGFGALSAALVLGVAWAGVVGVFLLAAALLVWAPTLHWPNAVAFLLLVVLFFPIRRYRVQGDLPFQPEPYRAIVALVILAWLASLLADRRVRIRRSVLDGALAAILLVMVASIILNPARVAPMETQVVKTLTFFLSFILVFYFVVSVVRDRGAVDLLVKILVAGGAVIAVLAAIESQTGWSPFVGLERFLPFLEPTGTGAEVIRGARLRASGPAEHPIALSAALALLVPFAVYLTKTGARRWWLPLGALVLGVLSTHSRTGIMMLLAVGLVFLWLRPRETRRLSPVLVPLLVATQLLLPGTLGTIKTSFFPEEGLIESQRALAGDCSSSGRIADIGPTLAEVSHKPLLGYGFGTRVVDGPERNACILDNQWLGTLYEVGVLGFLAWIALCVGAILRFARQAKGDASIRGWLLAAASASVAAFAVGMFTFDAFSFIQAVFLFFVVLALGASQMVPHRKGLAA